MALRIARPCQLDRSLVVIPHDQLIPAVENFY